MFLLEKYAAALYHFTGLARPARSFFVRTNENNGATAL